MTHCRVVVYFIVQGPVVTDNGNLILDWKFHPTKVRYISRIGCVALFSDLALH